MTAAAKSIELRADVERIAEAVLYEGYILYPYRPSAVKNQQRWNFGVLCPESYAQVQRGTENSTMQTQCLVLSDSEPTFDIKIRFLHLIARQVYKVAPDCREPFETCGHLTVDSIPHHFEPVRALTCNEHILQTWQEAVERDVGVERVTVGGAAVRIPFDYPDVSTNEFLFDRASGELVGLLVRRQESLNGEVEIACAPCDVDERLGQLTVRIHNRTALWNASTVTRDVALLKSFVSTHTILRVERGQFVSLLDTPEFAREAASACSNVGTFPVLAGDNDKRNQILSSPIILYDYPQVATESAGDLYDGTEIDEILSLRIMTLTDEEKLEIRDADDRARAILERTESLPADQFLKMHGVMKRM